MYWIALYPARYSALWIDNEACHSYSLEEYLYLTSGTDIVRKFGTVDPRTLSLLCEYFTDERSGVGVHKTVRQTFLFPRF